MKTLAVLISSTALTHAAVIINGSFETVTGPPPGGTVNGSQLYASGSTLIDGWTTTLAGVERFDPSTFGVGPADDGSFAIDLAYFTSASSGGIQQTIPTIPGEVFTLGFAATTATGGGRLGTAEIILMVNGTDVETFSISNSSTNLDWQNFSHEITATGASTVIEFQNRQNANLHFANIDSVQIIPEPTCSALTLLSIVFLTRRRR